MWDKIEHRQSIRKVPKIDKLLIIDDSPSFIQISKWLFRNLVRKIDGVTTLKNGLEALSKETYQFLLLDLHLPVGNGLDIVTEIKKQYPIMGIILVTAYDRPEVDTLMANRVLAGVIDKMGGWETQLTNLLELKNGIMEIKKYL